MSAFFRRLQRWLTDHPWVVVAFLSGAALGTTMALPILNVQLPDGVATLWGAILGAGVAVYGAAWHAGARERRHQDVLHGTVMGAILPLHSNIQAAVTAMSEVSTTHGPQWNGVQRELRKLDQGAMYVSQRLADLRPACYARADWLSSLELVIAGLGQIHEVAEHAAGRAGHHEQGNAPTSAQLDLWAKRVEVLQTIYSDLITTASRFPIPSTSASDILKAAPKPGGDAV